MNEHAALRRGLSLQEATDDTDELWALTSYDLCRLLIRECGWPAQHSASWLSSVLVQRLLEAV